MRQCDSSRLMHCGSEQTLLQEKVQHKEHRAGHQPGGIILCLEPHI